MTRWRRIGCEVCQQGLCCRLRTVDAIGNAHPMIGIPGEDETWETLYQGLNPCHAVEVSDMVLRHGLQVSGDAHRERLATDPEQLPEVVIHRTLHIRIGECKLLLLQSPSDKGSEEHLILRRPTGEFDAAEGTGHVGPLFDNWYDKTHAV